MNNILKLTKNLNDNDAFLITGAENIFYYSGFTSDEASLFISKQKCVLITDSRYTVQAKQEAPDFEIFIGTLSNFLKSVHETAIYFEDEKISVKELNSLKKLGKIFLPSQDVIDKPRAVKSMAEIEKIRRAEEIGDKAFNELLNYIKVGMTEKDVALFLEFYMKKHGAEKLSFDTICASGVRGAMPHGTASDKRLADGELITLDFGCIAGGYCSDMTRTIAIGTPPDELLNIYDIVLKAQKSAIDSIKSGVRCSDVDNVARKIITNAGYGSHFGHALGHSIGIGIHEKPCFSPKSKDITEIGNVITVEPGIYVENLGGVRIEDVVVVTENGFINLTKSPKELIII